MSSKLSLLAGILRVTKKVYTKVRKFCTADDADSPCERSLRQDETIDIPIIAILYMSYYLLSIKKYYVHTIRNTKYYDEGHQILISQPKLSFFAYFS